MPGTKEQATVATESIAYQAMTAMQWDLIVALMGGTGAMRAAGATFLPAFESEEDRDWKDRLGRTFLNPAFQDTVDKSVSRPFSKPLMLRPSSGLPDVTEAMKKDADLAGTTLHAFARDVLYDALKFGLSHVFVDFPRNPTRAVDKRPYLVHLKAKDIFAWRSEKDPGTDAVVLTHLRYFQTSIEQEGKYGEEIVHRIMEWNAPVAEPTAEGEPPNPRPRTTWARHKLVDTTSSGPQWIADGIGESDFVGIPLETIYLRKTGFMTAAPPLLDLAWLNLHHWQSSSDQVNILHVARVPILVEKSDNDPNTPNRAIGSSTKVQLGPDDDLSYTEHSGAAIGAGQEDLERTEKRMAEIGTGLYLTRPAQVTATGEQLDEARSTSQLQEYVNKVAAGMKASLEMGVEWDRLNGSSATLPDDFVVAIHTDFSIGLNTTDGPWLVEMRETGNITKRTLLEESKRRGLLQEDLDVDQEIQETQDDTGGVTLAIVPELGGPGAAEG